MAIYYNEIVGVCSKQIHLWLVYNLPIELIQLISKKKLNVLNWKIWNYYYQISKYWVGTKR